MRLLLLAGAIIACLAGVKAWADEPVVLYCIVDTNPMRIAPCPVAPSLPAPTVFSNPIATTITASATGTTGALTTTLGGTAGHTTYICGFTMTSGGTTTPVTANATVSGLAGAAAGTTLNFSYSSGSATSQGILGVAFPACIPALGQGQAITLVQPASGTGTQAAATSAWGLLQ